MKPIARKDSLLTQPVGGELIAYDQERLEAYRLDRVAAAVWSNCDGKTSVDELSDRLCQELDLHVDGDLVWATLVQLDRCGLLEGTPELTERAPRDESRVHSTLRPIGGIVESLLVPEPVAAYSW
jgi:hypothetical protein